jgi:hypothetical protein
MFWEGKELAPMSTCPLLADFVENAASGSCSQYAVAPEFAGAWMIQFVPPSLNHCCARMVPNYSLGSFSTQSAHLRVCPETSSWVAKFSEHQAD